MDTFSPYKHSSFSSASSRLLSYAFRPPYRPLSMIMDLARYEAMDAQRFDPMRCKKTFSTLAITWTKKDMGQIIRRMSQPELAPNGVVGGIWSDHELVLVPLEVSSHRNSIGSVLAPSLSSTSTSESTASASSASTYFTTSSPTAEGVSAASGLETSSSGTPSMGLRQVDTFDREDLIITRTIIRPPTQSTIRGMFSRPSSPMFSRPTSPLSRPNTPVFQALNCFRPTAFEREVDGIQTERGVVVTQPVLQVIVTQTREQYEQDLAFKDVVQEVYPEASRRRRTAQ